MIINQVVIFLIFILNGTLIGFLFDIFRIIRKTFKTKDIITYLEDILFWILTGLSIIYFVFNFSDGEIRGYMFMGIISGIAIYILTLSKIIIIVCNYLLNKIIRIVEIILLPIKFLIKHLSKNFCSIKKVLKRTNLIKNRWNYKKLKDF